MAQFDWTPEAIDTLTRLRAEGYSSSHIGGELGVSRNAVIGKANRLGLAQATKSSRTRHERKRLRTEAIIAPVDGKIKFYQLDRKHCRWPHGDPKHADFHFCGALPAGQSSYCAFHFKEATQEPKPWAPKKPVYRSVTA